MPRGPAGDFDAGSIFPASDPVIIGDEMRFYYGAFDMDHERFFPSTHKAIGVGTLPLDRLFGLVNTRPDAPGTILGRPMILRGSRLEINADVRGELTVAVLDWEGKPLPGYSFEDAAAIHGDSLRHAVSWKGRGLPQRPEPSRLKFRMEGEAALYAFTVS